MWIIAVQNLHYIDTLIVWLWLVIWTIDIFQSSIDNIFNELSNPNF